MLGSFQGLVNLPAQSKGRVHARPIHLFIDFNSFLSVFRDWREGLIELKDHIQRNNSNFEVKMREYEQQIIDQDNQL